VVYLLEPGSRAPAHSLRRRIGRDQLRIRGLELLQLTHVRIELSVGNFG
jgi:hypothetical protein